MKPIPTETDLEISFELCEVTGPNTQKRIDRVRQKIKDLQTDGERHMLLKLCELLIDIVEKWETKVSVEKLSDVIHCLQKANLILSKFKNKLFDKKKN